MLVDTDISTVLDPRYKKFPFTSNPNLFNRGWISGCDKSMHVTFKKDYALTTGSASATAAGRSNGGATRLSAGHQGDRLDTFDAALDKFLPSIEESQGTKDELQLYLDEPRVVIDPLVWWRSNEGRYPRLASMARDFLAIPGIVL